MPFSRTEPNVPDFQEDPNSPDGATDVSSFTFTFTEPAEHALILLNVEAVGFTTEPIQMQISGVTSDTYDFIDNTGTLTTSAKQFDLGTLAGREFTARIEIVRQPDNKTPAILCQGTETNFVAGTLTEGILQQALSAPVTQFTLSQPTDNITVEAEVFTRGVFDR